MEAKTVYLFLFDTLADWEIGYITTGISNPMMQAYPGRYSLKTFSHDGAAVSSMGGLHLTPDLSIKDVSLDDAAMLILPGGLTWEKGENQEALELARICFKGGIPVAAICGATLGLASVGILNSVAHTSNAKEYLLMSEQYTGADYYRDESCVSDQGVITAPGTTSLEFSREVFNTLELYTPEVLAAWYKLFKTSSPEAYFELMQAVTA